MTRRKWTSADQEEWLKARIARFSDAQVNKTTTKEFFPEILKEWREAWPCPGPTPVEIAQAGSVEKAIQKRRSQEITRIKTWFHNHTRGTTSGNGVRGLLKMKGKQKTLQEWQVYHIMTYESQWKAVIDEEWEKYKSQWKAEKPTEDLDETRFSFMSSFMRQKYTEESEEVQNNVRRRRDELKVELDVDGEDKNHAYQEAINRLPRTLAVWGESIKKQTGWNITFLVGGPSPRQNGKIVSYTLHCGTTPDGQDFEGYLGKDGYNNHIITTFDDFLHETFPPEVCISRSLESKANTPDADETEEKTRSNDGDGGETKANTPEPDENDGEDYETDQDDATIPTVANRATSGKSEYSRIREANIKQNKELLSQLGLQFGFSRTLKAEKLSKEKGKKATATSSSKTRTKGDHMSSEGPVASVTATSATTSEITALNGDNNVAHQVEDAPVVVDTENLLTKEPYVLNANGSPSLTTSSILQSDTSANRTMVSAESQDPHQAPVLTTPASTLTNNSDTMNIVPSASAGATEPTSNPDPMKVEQGKKEEIRFIQMDVDHEKGEEVHTLSSTNVALVTPPAWLTTLNMDVYLQECSDAKAWQGLVQSLYKFEEGNSINGTLPTTLRPEEVKTWIKNKKKNSPPDVDADKYGSSFMAWWIAIQPAWRVADDGSFNYEVPEDEDWCALHKGGKAGLYTVVVALSWWVRALTPEIPGFRAWKAVHDVQWVIDKISTKYVSSGKKRQREESAPSGMSKRSRRG